MNLAKYQDKELIFSNWRHFYSQIMNYQKDIRNFYTQILYTNNELSERYQKEKLRRQSHSIYYCNKKNRAPRNKFNQEGKRPALRKL